MRWTRHASSQNEPARLFWRFSDAAINGARPDRRPARTWQPAVAASASGVNMWRGTPIRGKGASVQTGISRKRFITGAAAAAGLAALVPRRARAARPVVLKFSVDLATDHPTTIGAMAAGQQIESATQGRIRFETQSGPPGDGGDDSDGRGEIPGELVVACGDASPFLERAEHTLDEVAVTIGNCVEGIWPAPGCVVGNDDAGATCGDAVSQRRGVVALVGDESLPDWRVGQQIGSDSDVRDIAGTEQEGAQPPYSVADGMDLCCAAAARAADCLGCRTPFPPAEARCALTAELSIIATSAGTARASASNRRIQMPRPLQRFHRL